MDTDKTKSALLIIDVQNDFLKDGALEVKNGNDIIPLINDLQNRFDHVIATKDWHPANHKSFASRHPKNKTGDLIDLNGIEQILWPDHCIENTYGSDFPENLNISKIEKIVKKGNNVMIDSYSGFFDNDMKSKTELDDYLKHSGINTLYICGLATDYCVKFTALDAAKLGYKTFLIEDACKGVNLSADDSDKAIEEMKTKGIKIIEANSI